MVVATATKSEGSDFTSPPLIPAPENTKFSLRFKMAYQWVFHSNDFGRTESKCEIIKHVKNSADQDLSCRPACSHFYCPSPQTKLPGRLIFSTLYFRRFSVADSSTRLRHAPLFNILKDNDHCVKTDEGHPRGIGSLPGPTK